MKDEFDFNNFQSILFISIILLYLIVILFFYYLGIPANKLINHIIVIIVSVFRSVPYENLIFFLFFLIYMVNEHEAATARNIKIVKKLDGSTFIKINKFMNAIISITRRYPLSIEM